MSEFAIFPRLDPDVGDDVLELAECFDGVAALIHLDRDRGVVIEPLAAAVSSLASFGQGLFIFAVDVEETPVHAALADRRLVALGGDAVGFVHDPEFFHGFLR